MAVPVETIGVDPGTGRIGAGTTLVGTNRVDGSQATGPMGMIQKIGIAGVQVQDIDVTTMNAPGRWMKFVAGLKDAKELSIDLIYESENMAILLAATGAANETWTITFPDTSTYAVLGHISRLGTAIPYNDKMTQQVTIRLSGPPVYAVGSY